jgi:hypothetical protein
MRRAEVIQAERETSPAIRGVRNLIHHMVRGRQVAQGEQRSSRQRGNQPSYQQGPEPNTPYGQRKTGSMRIAEVIQAERETSRAISRVRNLIHHMVRGRQVA